MAKTKPIGVRFDETLLGKFKEMGYPTPQRALSFLEAFWAKNMTKIIEANNKPENKERILNERKTPPQPLGYGHPVADVIEAEEWREEIQKQIKAIQLERIAENRDTIYGRKVWANEQKQRIEELKKRLK